MNEFICSEVKSPSSKQSCFHVGSDRVNVALLHQLTGLISKLSGMQSENPFSGCKKENNHELSQWLPVQTLLLYHIARLDFEWSCHFASFSALSPAFPQVQQSCPCSRVTAVLCLVGHWSSPPLRGESTSLFSCAEVTSHLQASCADWVSLSHVVGCCE